VLYNEKDACCIVDPGCYSMDERQELQEFIQAKQLSPKILLNTHCHLDHIFGNKFVHDQYGLPLHLHELEKPVLEYGPMAGLMWNLPFENYKGDLIFLKEGDRVLLGEDQFKVLFTPGHSPGSICFYCEAQQFVMGGDVLFRSGIGRTDLPGGNTGVLMNSIRKQLFVLPDGVLVYPGHGEPTTIGFEKRHNPFLNDLLQTP
jgi:hydroxyacylglutathione hydrolase